MAKRTGPGSRLSRADILRAAYRHFELGETQASIADDLGISTGYLARRLKKARADGWVRFHVDVPAEHQKAADLMQRFPLLSEARVVEGVAEGSVPAIGTVLAGWLNDLLATPSGEEGHVSTVATGGGTIHMQMLDRILPREDPCDVGPTALTPLSGRVPRWPASTIAAVMSFRLDSRSGARQSGTLYDLSIEPVSGDLAALTAWWERVRTRDGYAQMEAFWDAADVVFIASTTLDNLYPEQRDHLRDVGLGPDELRRRGVVGVAANQFFDASGARVKISDDVPGYVPAIGLETVAKKAAARRAGDSSRAVIIDVRAEQAPAARHLVEAGIVTHLATDLRGAEALLAG